MSESKSNPYAAPTLGSEAEAIDDEQPAKSSFLRAWIRWALISTVVAIPSFLLSNLANVDSTANVIGIATSIALFSLVFAAIDVHSAWRRLMRGGATRYAIMLTISLRILVSVIFPIGMVNDLVIGHKSIHAAELLTGENAGPYRHDIDAPPPPRPSVLFAMLATAFQGILLALEMCVVGGLIYGCLRLRSND